MRAARSLVQLTPTGKNSREALVFAMHDDAVGTAEAVMRLMEADRFAEIDELRVPVLRDQVPADEWRDPWQELIAMYGAVSRVGPPVSESAGPGNTMVKIRVTCERGAFAVLMAVDDAGALQGLHFAPRRRPSRSRRGSPRRTSTRQASPSTRSRSALSRGRHRAR